MRTITVLAVLLVGLSLVWYTSSPRPGPPTLEETIAEVQANVAGAEPIAPTPIVQKDYTAISGLTSFDDFVDHPYFAYYHKWGSRIAVSRMGQRVGARDDGIEHKAIFYLDEGLANVPETVQARWTIDDEQYADYSEDGFAKFESSPEESSERVGELLLIQTNSVTGLPTSNPSKRTVVYDIPPTIPRKDELEGDLTFKVSGIKASPTHGGSSQYRRVRFEESYKIRWRVVESEYLILMPKKSDREFGGDLSIHQGIDFVMLPNGNSYLINNQEITGPYTQILPPNMEDGKPVTSSKDPSEIPEAAEIGYIGWGFFDDLQKGWMIMRKHKDPDEEYLDFDIAGPFSEISDAGIVQAGPKVLRFIYKDGDQWFRYNDGDVGLAE